MGDSVQSVQLKHFVIYNNKQFSLRDPTPVNGRIKRYDNIYGNVKNSIISRNYKETVQFDSPQGLKARGGYSLAEKPLHARSIQKNPRYQSVEQVKLAVDDAITKVILDYNTY